MKRLLGLAILAAGLAIPAHAQGFHGGASAGSSSNGLPTNGGGGGFGGGFGGGLSSAGNRLPAYPLANFNLAAVSGTQAEYVPSTFVSYDQAVAEGREILATPPKTLVQAAREQASTRTDKARFALVQDRNGNAVIVTR